MKKNFYRFPKAGVFELCGVCAGLAYWFGIKTWIVRLALVFFTILFNTLGCILVVAYILFWIFAPKSDTPEDYDKVCK